MFRSEQGTWRLKMTLDLTLRPITRREILTYSMNLDDIPSLQRGKGYWRVGHTFLDSRTISRFPGHT
jgi:hypothetical protein